LGKNRERLWRTRGLSDAMTAEAYSTAHEPKKLHLLKGGHYEPYGIRLAETAGAACDWFTEHLVVKWGQ